MNTPSKVTFVNLTQHIINVYSEDGKDLLANIDPSGTIARCKTSAEMVAEVDGISFFRTEFGSVEDLPAPVENVIYITSMLVRSAVPTRIDVASPGALLRDDAGKPIGCKGLSVS